jgi:hypothetical protein
MECEIQINFDDINNRNEWNWLYLAQETLHSTIFQPNDTWQNVFQYKHRPQDECLQT